jgi:hypothetical protein
MQKSKHRMQNIREPMPEAELKPVQLWVLDTNAPGFAAECRRQSLMMQNNPAGMHDLDLVAEIADWGSD